MKLDSKCLPFMYGKKDHPGLRKFLRVVALLIVLAGAIMTLVGLFVDDLFVKGILVMILGIAVMILSYLLKGDDYFEAHRCASCKKAIHAPKIMIFETSYDREMTIAMDDGKDYYDARYGRSCPHCGESLAFHWPYGVRRGTLQDEADRIVKKEAIEEIRAFYR